MPRRRSFPQLKCVSLEGRHPEQVHLADVTYSHNFRASFPGGFAQVEDAFVRSFKLCSWGIPTPQIAGRSSLIAVSPHSWAEQPSDVMEQAAGFIGGPVFSVLGLLLVHSDEIRGVIPLTTADNCRPECADRSNVSQAAQLYDA